MVKHSGSTLQQRGSLLDLRKQAGLSQTGLASLLGVSSNTVARWERGERQPPPYLELAVIHLALCNQTIYIDQVKSDLLEALELLMAVTTSYAYNQIARQHAKDAIAKAKGITEPARISVTK